ncbi:putative RNA recognition motif (a k a RRM RBD or RNP domain) [Trypanosoma vivax]|uniref:Putative RNA-binding protein n=1 Tax=Trypanosoma vivax (strain Y486) TaxID=1055687 RepID=G0TT40_TRYVY|nr:putative RNA-binding protein [Trypanosoma vivax]KAH8619643.1 putative RNA recognition motif (a k a RRM RBD or RNP domain) [Trypanosoma vivax]CCC47121.1 putative RNA-binding protein [Trypanosoma vivax Y486]
MVGGKTPQRASSAYSRGKVASSSRRESTVFRGGQGQRGGRGCAVPHLSASATLSPAAGAGKPNEVGAGAMAGKQVPVRRDEANRSNRVVTTITENGTEIPKKLNTKVFIDGLPYENKGVADSTSLEEELKQFALAWKVGKPLRLIKKDGQGFGFLVFQSPHSVDVAVRVLNGRKFLGRALRVEVPKPKDVQAASGDTSGADVGKSSYSRQVLLSDLAKVSQPDVIREIMRDVAPQLEKRLETIKMTSKNRKAFLTFVSSEDVAPAVQFLDGLSMFGRRVTAAPAAAPGSLPYSRVQLRGAGPEALAKTALSRNGGTDTSASGMRGEEDEEVAVLPLGVEAPIMKQAGVRVGAATSTPTTTVPRNVTGRTEKYNLLDSGPAEVFVGNLGDTVTEEQLRSHFSVCGRINSCEIIVNKTTQLPTGIARIVFALPAYAAYAQKHMHGSCLHGHLLRVDRGDETSAPLASELQPHDEDSVDEDGYMEHFGVLDKEAYFKGTSFEDKSNTKKRKAAADTKMGNKRKKAKEEKGGTSISSTSPGGRVVAATSSIAVDDDDDDDEEHFYDVESDREVASPSSVKRGKGKRAPGKAKKSGKVKPRRSA